LEAGNVNYNRIVFGRTMRWIALTVLAIVMTMTLTACDVTPERTDSASPDWSRGIKIGEASLDNPIAIVSDSQGRRHLAWVGLSDSRRVLRYAQVDSQANVLLERALDIPLRQPQDPRFLFDAQGGLHLFFLAKGEVTWDEWGLFHTRLGAQGELLAPIPCIGCDVSGLAPPQLLSLPLEVAQYHQEALNPQGQIEVFWSRELETGIYHLRLSTSGEILLPNSVLVPQAARPAVVADRTGTLYLAWLRTPEPLHLGFVAKEMNYAVFQPATRTIADKTTVALLEIPPGVVIDGPSIALDNNYTYVLWVQDKRGGKGETGADGYYVAFPTGSPAAQMVPMRFYIPASATTPYQARQDGFAYQHLVALPQRGLSTDYLVALRPLAGQQPELVTVFALRLASKQRGLTQLGSAVLTRGQLVGYQLINDTLNLSLAPAITIGPANDLSLAWLEFLSEGRYEVRYASTAPAVRQKFSALTRKDITSKGLGLLWYDISYIGFLPLALAWNLLSFIGMVLYTVFHSDSTLDNRQARIALLLVILVQVVAKIFLLWSLFGAGESLLRAGLFFLPTVLAAGAMAPYWWSPYRRSPFVS
jgi:hypothetical protein